MKHLSIISLATIALAAAGCSSSDSGNLPTQYNLVEGLAAAGEAGTLEAASADMMVGTATLIGALGIEDVNDPDEPYGEVLADLTMNADFTNGTVSADATNFAQYSEGDLDETIDGTVSMSGTITGTTLSASGSGVITGDESTNIDLDLAGNFVDYEGSLGAYGDVTATVNDEEEFGGAFAVIEP
jgi:hypothetical protein